jgi:hypothetical protein
MLRDIIIFMRETHNAAHLKWWAMKILLKGGEPFWATFKWPLAKMETFRGD